MSRWPPDIVYYQVANDWAVTVKWQLDPILDGDPPESVEVIVDGFKFGPTLPPSTSEVTIDGATAHGFSGPQLAIQIDFVWSDTFESPQSSSVVLPWPPTAIPPKQAPGGPSVPTISLLKRSPKTLSAANSITIHWSSYSFTDGSITWGPVGQGSRTHSIKPKSAPRDYSGNFTTDVPLTGSQPYQFKVTVVNSLTTNVPVSSNLVVLSAGNYRSLGAFLDASGADKSAGLRAAAGGGTLSLADMLGL